MEYERNFISRTPCRTSLLIGKMYTLEVMAGHEARCYENFRMRKNVFLNFCDTLRDIGNLSDDKKVCVEEGVAMFLIIICHNMRHRVVAERFQHSLQIVSKWFKRVLRAVCKLGRTIIVPRNQTITHPYIGGTHKYFPYFKKCIGAIDGTHVSAWAPTSKQTTFRGRKVLITQNVLAVCNFDMLFTFVYSGWEGTANDSRVFLDALTPANDFPKPIGDQFYLVDSGFPNMSGYLAPFRKTRYHLRDFRDGGRPRGKQELFNHRHSSLRNVIERCFGVLKARFPILKMMPNYPVRR
ncbi:PREDICTED: uncharacterized protein LOC109339964 [Lupinus angustifolius]|uniref:uncharacterized protein LOC109339964 n=1 Tax=Lupinus angustifolius TaxID=3871 RepID=UPI00092EBB56|nr:PREDICTED: uncharacterized protein LOC109339964 [Lupinus angustifolius]